MTYKNSDNEWRSRYALHQTAEWKEYHSRYSKAYALTNPNKVKKWAKESRKRHPETARRGTRKYCERHPDRVTASNHRPEAKAARKAYKKSPKGQVAEKRYAKKKWSNTYMKDGKLYKLPPTDIQLEEEWESKDSRY